jgi:hypothetical protein
MRGFQYKFPVDMWDYPLAEGSACYIESMLEKEYRQVFNRKLEQASIQPLRLHSASTHHLLSCPRWSVPFCISLMETSFPGFSWIVLIMPNGQGRRAHQER